MKTIRILHPCCPEYDNLGEVAANAAVVPMFRQRGIAVERIEDDLWARRKVGLFLDGRIDEFNASFDMVMIGPAGFLGPKMIDSVFMDPDSWDRLTVPLVFNGVGLVAAVDRPVWYTAMDRETHVMRALRRASAVSTRELNSWLLAARAMGRDTGRLTLAGCPSIWIARCNPRPAPVYDIALNLSFMHENCRQHIQVLLQVAKIIAARKQRVLWVCHSQLDADQAHAINRQLGLGFDVVHPLSAEEAGAAYASCERALVTRFHAGIFCLANTVPFGFIGYDMKCWHLMTMLADEPYRYVLPIDRLAHMDLEGEIQHLFARLEANQESLRKAQGLLVTHFEEQTDRFVDTVVAAVQATPPLSDIAAENTLGEASGGQTA